MQVKVPTLGCPYYSTLRTPVALRRSQSQGLGSWR